MEKRIIYPISAFIIVFVIWELIVRFSIIKSVFLPPPTTVILAIFKNFGYWLISILITLKHIGIGYVIGTVLAILIGLAIGWYKTIDRSIAPLLLIISPIPIVTFLPLFIIWFGLGEFPIILCAIIAAFFPSLFNTSSGVKKVDKSLIEVAKNFGINDRDLLKKVILPGALPHIANGLRLSIQLTFLVTPVAEMIMGDVGLGGFIWKSADLFKTDRVILGQFTLGFIGLLIFKVFDFIEKKYLLPWMRIGDKNES